ncbi:MAG: adenylosuccinate synthetase, partial [Myxococcota bacterium]|nr:adenylosuccinate synthetase [Myxococcota bacterium]
GNSALIMPYHCALDRAREGARAVKIGTTGRGIGPTYEDVASRRSIPINALQDVEDLHARVEQVLPEKNAILTHYGAKTFTASEVVDNVMTYASRITPHIAQTGQLIDQALTDGSKVLFEGAQGALLDVVHGTVPYVTSSHTIGAAACTGTGIGPNRISRVLGIAKAYVTRVGGGPMPTAIGGEKEEKLRQLGGEFGATTGRPRRCGWLDLPALRYAVRISGITELALTKLDVLSALGDLKICTAYRLHGETLAPGIFPAADGLQQVEPVFETVPGWDQDISHIRKEGNLPKAAQEYIARIEDELGVPITILSVGADRDATLLRGFEF